MAKTASTPRIKRPRPAGYRHELKFFLNQGQYIELRTRLRQAMQRDENALRSGGEYYIRSLYFDDMLDSAMREKLAGVDSRDKFRIRVYNESDAVIKLECKHKQEGYIQKQSLSLSRDECDRLCAGDYRFLYDRREPFARRMFAEFAVKRLRPVVIVDYWREPFVFPLQDVRVTFDRDVRTAYRGVELFDFSQPTYPAISGYDMVLEVKYNEYMPAYIRELLQTDTQVRSAISKYCLCRKYEI